MAVAELSPWAVRQAWEQQVLPDADPLLRQGAVPCRLVVGTLLHLLHLLLLSLVPGGARQRSALLGELLWLQQGGALCQRKQLVAWPKAPGLLQASLLA